MCDLDEILRALADGRRRRVLHCLKRHHTVSLPDVAELLAEHEWDEDVSQIPREEVRDVYFSLYHKHVPKLEDANLIEYYQDDDRVAWADETASALTQVRDKANALLQVS